MLTHLAAQATRDDAMRRQQVKLALTRRLYERGYGRERVLSLFRFIDWLLELPPEQESAFWREMQTYEEERAMPYMTSVERRAVETGKREALRRIVQARFQIVPEEVERRIADADAAALDQMLDRVSIVQRADDL